MFRHARKLGLEGIVSKRLDSRYRSGRSPDWLKVKNPEAPAVRREAEEDWGRGRATQFAEERRNLTQEAREIGLSENMATIVQLMRLLREGVTRRRGMRELVIM
jgi:hypothetical protein